MSYVKKRNSATKLAQASNVYSASADIACDQPIVMLSFVLSLLPQTNLLAFIKAAAAAKTEASMSSSVLARFPFG
eukprot:scaffold143055_cov50-Prasinocladus_malaysianus.AAC.1